MVLLLTTDLELTVATLAPPDVFVLFLPEPEAELVDVRDEDVFARHVGGALGVPVGGHQQVPSCSGVPSSFYRRASVPSRQTWMLPHRVEAYLAAVRVRDNIIVYIIWTRGVVVGWLSIVPEAVTRVEAYAASQVQ